MDGSLALPTAEQAGGVPMRGALPQDDDIVIRLAPLIEQPGRYRLVSLSRPKNGRVADNGDGTVVYRPRPGYSGPDHFDYTVADLGGALSTARVSLSIEPREARPAASAPGADAPSPVPQAAAEKGVTASPGFARWLAETGASLAVAFRQSGQLLLIGRTPDGALSFFDRRFDRCATVHVADDETVYVGTRFQLWRLENTAKGGTDAAGYDRVFVPRAAFTTGDVGVQDIFVGAGGEPVFANRLFSCLAAVGAGASFYPVWQPYFVSRLAPETRCNLSGVAAENGVPRYVTVAAASDNPDGWRAHAIGGGAVIDVACDSVVAAGLTLPRAPRLHADGTLYALNAGAGELVRIDPATRRHEVIARLPGYARSLSFAGGDAIVTVTAEAEETVAGTLPVFDRLALRGERPAGGLYVVDLAGGRLREWLRFGALDADLGDAAALPGCTRPAAIGFQTDEISRVLYVGGERRLSA